MNGFVVKPVNIHDLYNEILRLTPKNGPETEGSDIEKKE